MKKIVISTAATSAILISPAFANMDNFLNDSVVEVTGPSSMKSAAGTLLYGGGVQLRASNYTLRPFQVTAPSIKAGCGGIDAAFGAFSFLSIEQLVKLLEAMMAQAPGVAFDLALKVLCPSCSDTLKALQQLANQINGMNLDGCSANKALAGWMGESINKSLGQGTSGPDWLKSVGDVANYASGAIGNFQKNFMKSEGCDPGDNACSAKFFMQQEGDNTSFLFFIMKESIADPEFMELQQINFLRTFVGDIRIAKFPDDAPDGATNGKLTFMYPEWTLPQNFKGDFDENSDATTVLLNADMNSKNIIKMMVGDIQAGETINAKVKDENGALVNFAVTGSLKAQIKTKLDNVQHAIANRQIMDPSVIGFIGSFRMPIYPLINKLAVMPNGELLLDRIKDKLAAMMAYELSYEYISRAKTQLLRFQSKVDLRAIDTAPFSCGAGEEAKCGPNIQAHIAKMIYNMNGPLSISYAMVAESSAALKKAITDNSKMMADLNDLQHYTLSRTNPRLFEQYMFSNTLSTTNHP